MDGSRRRKVAVAAAAALAVAGGGGALAATQLGSSPQSESAAVVSDAASQLGVAPTALSKALKTALEHRVDAAVAAGRLTKAEGDELKARIASGPLPFFPGGRFHGELGHPGGFGGFEAAAKYLGLTDAQLRTQLEAGKSLAQVAKDNGKSVDGLVQALVDSAKTRLDAAVKDGRLTQTQETAILSQLKQHVTDLVNRTGHEPFEHERFRGAGPPGGFGFRPPGF